jgi:phosphosulfolactate synthase
MNIPLPHIPLRQKKPRSQGLTMVMDKGLSLREAEDMVMVSGDLIDFVKLGFGTSLITPRVAEKVRIYKDAGIKVYTGGTLFEAFIIRGIFDDYRRYIDALKLDTVEVSDGSMYMDHDLKCDYIRRLAKDYLVLSEVGSKDAGVHIANDEWVNQIQSELEAGSSWVIAEARESGTVGIFDPSGMAETSLIDKINHKIPPDKILWEAPMKSQQAWFITYLGSHVNLGNIAPNEVIALETLRLGLRSDTFMQFLPDHLKQS